MRPPSILMTFLPLPFCCRTLFDLKIRGFERPSSADSPSTGIREYFRHSGGIEQTAGCKLLLPPVSPIRWEIFYETADRSRASSCGRPRSSSWYPTRKGVRSRQDDTQSRRHRSQFHPSQRPVENREAQRLPWQEKCLSRRIRLGLHRRLNEATSGGPGWNRLR